MGKGFTMVEWRLIRDSLLKVTPGRDQADALWEVIEKINAQLGEHDEQRKKSAGRNKG